MQMFFMCWLVNNSKTVYKAAIGEIELANLKTVNSPVIYGRVRVFRRWRALAHIPNE